MTSIFYLSRVNLSTNRAHVHNIAKTCESLGATLVTTSANSEQDEVNFLKEHQIVQKFPIVILNSSGNYFSGSRFRMVNWLEVILANFTMIKLLLIRRQKINIVYLRDQHLFLAVLFAKYFLCKPFFFEAHAAQRQKHTQVFLNLMVRTAKGVIAISFALKKSYEKLNKNIIVAFCFASEKENFPYHKNKIELRKELNLPPDKFLIGYAGRLDLTGVHSNYEIDKIIEALRILPENIVFLIIGATEKEAKKIGSVSNLMVYPRLSRLEIPSYLLACDILVIPKLGDLPGDSPAKMFEYLAAKRPIVAAKTEPVSEVLRHEENALLVFSNTAEEWAEAIKRLIENKALSDAIARKAFEDSQKYTWEKRAQIIVDFLSKI